MTGWRIGYAGGPAPLIREMTKMQSQSTSGACSISQAAATAALNGEQGFIADHNAIFKQRRDRVSARLNRIPGLRCHCPEGAFYLFPECGAWLGKTTAGGRRLQSDYDIADALLEEQHVAVVHGSAYGLSPHLRISYATASDLLESACDRIQEFRAGLT
jgi:aspartate aminotransferase